MMASILERSMPSIPALSAAEMMRADACAETPAVFSEEELSFVMTSTEASTAGDIAEVNGLDCVGHE